MLLMDFVEKKAAELKAAGNKNVTFIKAGACKISKYCYSIELFTQKPVALDTEVEEKRPENDREEIPGAEVTIEYIKPRCRKPVREYYRIAIANVTVPVKIGDRVIGNWGAMYPHDHGTITDIIGDKAHIKWDGKDHPHYQSVWDIKVDGLKQAVGIYLETA